MPDLDDLNSDPYQFLECISTEKLKSIVRADFASGDSDDAVNDEFITRVLEVITQREEEDPNAPHFDVDAGWKNFLEKDRPTEDLAPGGHSGKTERQADLKVPQPKRAGHSFLRIIAIAAIAICMCVAAASAFEFDVFKMVAQWTREIFQFQSETVPSNSLEADSGIVLNSSQTLEALLAEQGVTQPVSPRWIPAGFHLASLDAYTDMNDPMFTALYEDPTEERTIVVSAIIYSTPQVSLQEKDADPVEMYSVA